jgi:hypothetical protein
LAYVTVLVVTAIGAVLLTIHPEPAAADLVILSDGFETGDLSAWSEVTTQVTPAPRSRRTLLTAADMGELRSTISSGARAFIRKALSLHDRTSAQGAFNVQAEGATGGIVLFRFFDEAGNRLISLYRQNGSGELWVKHSGIYYPTGKIIPFSTWHDLELRAAVGVAGSGIVEIRLDGVEVYATSSAALGTAPIASVQLGNETAAQAYVLFADDITIGVPGPSSTSAPTPTAKPATTATPTSTPTALPSPAATPGGINLSATDDGMLRARCQTAISAEHQPGVGRISGPGVVPKVRPSAIGRSDHLAGQTENVRPTARAVCRASQVADNTLE